MEYGRRDPIKGKPSVRPTAVTNMTIEELLAEEAKAKSKGPGATTAVVNKTIEELLEDEQREKEAAERAARLEAERAEAEEIAQIRAARAAEGTGTPPQEVEPAETLPPVRPSLIRRILGR